MPKADQSYLPFFSIRPSGIRVPVVRELLMIDRGRAVRLRATDAPEIGPMRIAKRTSLNGNP